MEAVYIDISWRVWTILFILVVGLVGERIIKITDLKFKVSEWIDYHLKSKR